MRGKLTDNVQNVAEKYLGRKLKSTMELRFLPYLDYVMKNNGRIDPQKINREERELIEEYSSAGWITRDVDLNIQVKNKQFYNAIQEILWEAYVSYNQG